MTGRHAEDPLAGVQKECRAVPRDRTDIGQTSNHPVERRAERTGQFEFGLAEATPHDGDRLFLG
jgi:hypothetical protein